MTRSRTNLIAMYRQERKLGVLFAFLLLLVPFLHPLAEANAAGRPDAGVICSSFGSAGVRTNPAMPDDCPMGIIGCGVVAAVAGIDTATLEVIRFPETPATPLQLERLSGGGDLALWQRPPGRGPPAIS